jgi:alpha-tubulin suppressor-like RCC1 family protein
LGDGTRTSRPRRFRAVKGLPTVRVTKGGSVRISTGRHHSCAATRQGRVYCWGANQNAQLGTPPGKSCSRKTACLSRPSAVPGLRDALDVVSRYNRSCARIAGGKVRCWGQTGHGPKEQRRPPTDVTGLSSVAQLALGRAHMCALLHDGRVRCWGANTDGQCGVGEGRLVALPSAVVWDPPVDEGDEESAIRRASQVDPDA